MDAAFHEAGTDSRFQALLRGFISAVGLVIFIAQLPPILGLDDIIAAAPSADSTISKLHLVVFNIGQTHALVSTLSTDNIFTLKAS